MALVAALVLAGCSGDEAEARDLAQEACDWFESQTEDSPESEKADLYIAKLDKAADLAGRASGLDSRWDDLAEAFVRQYRVAARIAEAKERDEQISNGPDLVNGFMEAGEVIDLECRKF
ncbi:hypothetical protein [Nocardioides alcanivorans]|uniref:hypothetical protein n=1 Tax=Nocardioides alcanivorans TaxID=2897352 RepID=UPI001F23228F|nr:hypothetical protein [Nocardioides alcanivorans]